MADSNYLVLRPASIESLNDCVADLNASGLYGIDILPDGFRSGAMICMGCFRDTG